MINLKMEQVLVKIHKALWKYFAMSYNTRWWLMTGHPPENSGTFVVVERAQDEFQNILAKHL